AAVEEERLRAAPGLAVRLGDVEQELGRAVSLVRFGEELHRLVPAAEVVLHVPLVVELERLLLVAGRLRGGGRGGEQDGAGGGGAQGAVDHAGILPRRRAAVIRRGR